MLLFFISILIICLSIYPWSIRDFHQKQIEAYKTYTDNKKASVRVFPTELYQFIRAVENLSAKDDSIVFISLNGEGEKEFFLASYYLFPRRIYWISNPQPGPINWWERNDMSSQSILVYMDRYKISWIVSYDFGLPASSQVVLITKNNNFALYKKT